MSRRDRPGPTVGPVAEARSRAGATFGDVLLLIAMAALVAAMIYPGIKARAMERHLETVVGEVETLLAAAERVRADTGTWPEVAPSGAIGRPLADTLRQGLPAYRLEWRRLAIADVPEPLSDAEAEVPEDLDDGDRVPAPPEPSLHHVGLVSVHAADDAVFDALLGRYGAERSFVHDTVWTLVLPRSPAPAR